jgi:hypothetical protein
MSHNVELQGVKFTDLAILEKATRELIAEGVISGEFRKGDVPIRGWRGTGEGAMWAGHPIYGREQNHVCPAGIVLNQGKYDIGFNWDAKQNAYVPFIENGWRPPVAADQSALNIEGQACGIGNQAQAALVGKLSQRYAVLMAEKNAAMQGLPTRRIKAKGGQIQLEVTHRG